MNTTDKDPGLTALRAALAQREREVAALRAAIAVLEGRPVPFGPEGRTPEFSGLGIVDAATRVLQEKGPLTTREVAEELLDRGIRTQSKNFSATVYASLSSASGIRRTSDGRWELT